MGTKKIILLSFFIVVMSTAVVSVWAQELPGLRQTAEQNYQIKNYSLAVKQYLVLVQKKERTVYLEHIADCYRQMRDYRSAEVWYEKLARLARVEPVYMLQYGEVLMNNAKYEPALEQFNKYLPFAGANVSIVNNYIRSCKTFETLSTPDPTCSIKNESAINTIYSEFGAVVNPRNKKLVFTSDRSLHPSDLKQENNSKKIYGWTGRPYLRLYEAAYKADGTLGACKQIDTSNGVVAHNGPAVFTRDGNRMYFTRAVKLDENKSANFSFKKQNGANRLEIYYIDFKNGKWSDPKSVSFNRADQYSVGNPALSPDDKTLYFVSDMPGGQGGTDLYCVELRETDNFSAPINLGPQINTYGDEQFPTMSANGTLYFSSNGMIGLGGLDIFRSEGSHNRWSKPVNLGAPVNSSEDDYHFQPLATNLSIGYFSSNRSGGTGNDDIYAFAYQFMPVVQVHVVRADTKEPVPMATVKLFAHGMMAPEGSIKTDDQGKAILRLRVHQKYFVQAFQEKISDTSQIAVKPLSLKSTDTIKLLLELDYNSAMRGTHTLAFHDKGQFVDKTAEQPDDEKELTLENLVPGKTFVLRHIYYDFDKWAIRMDGTKELDKLVALLKEKPSVRISLNAFTDSRGSDDYNLLLSELRAISAKEYLEDNGINSLRLKAKGFGETHLVNHCANGRDCTEFEHQKNRRTEITVLSPEEKPIFSSQIK